MSEVYKAMLIDSQADYPGIGDNVALFAGDPLRVTAFGQSAGETSLSL